MEGTTMRKILSVLIIAIIATTTLAQSPTSTQIYKMNADALKLVLDYKAQANMNKPRRFVRLFANEDMQIYNDLLGLSNQKTLSVKNYRTLMEKEALYPTIKVQNFRKNNIYKENGLWMMDITFEKELSYTDKCGVLFSTEEYYGEYHTINMSLVWDANLETCTIAKLSGKNNSNTKALTDYKVIVASDDAKDQKRENNVRVNGRHLKFNSFSQCIIPANAEITYVNDDDMKFELVQNETGCEVYSIAYNPMSMRLKPHYNIGVVPFGKSANGLSLSKSIHHEFGLDLGYMIPTNGLFQMGFYAGVGFASSSVVLGMDTIHYHYQAGSEADIDGDSYTRHYTIERASQKLSMKDLTIPIYLDFNFHVHKIVSLYLDLGIKNYINLSANLSDLTGTYSSWGVYPQYSDLVLDHTTGLTQFAASGTALPAQTTSSTMDINGYSMDLLSALGVRVKLKDKQFFPLYFDFSIGYQHSLLAPYKNANALTLSDIQGNVSAQEAFSTYTVESGESLLPLSAFVSELKRKMVTFNFGITYKF